MQVKSSKKTVLITGANGFIGLNTVKIFSKRNEFDVYALVHKNISKELSSLENIKIIQADVTDENLDIPEFDIVVHAMGLAKDIGNKEKFKKLNFDSVKIISKFAKEKFIYISSTDVYGIKDFENADETTNYSNFPKNYYPEYKIKSELWLKNEYKKNYVIIRPAAVWGENDLTLEKRVIDFLKTSSYIVHFGKWKGKNRWPLASVENVAKTILAVCLSDIFDKQAINIIDSKKTTIDEYYREIAKKYFPNKAFKTLCLPMQIGKIIGFVSTFLSNLLKLNDPIFDPTYYSLHHVSSNLDFDNKRMLSALEILK